MKSFFKKMVVGVLKAEVRMALLRFRPKIVAITGSVGKTSTKDAIACALAPFFSVRKSEKSYNSDFGIPLTILGLKNAAGNPILWLKNIFIGATRIFLEKKEPQWLVLEVGAGEPGDIARFAQMLSPDIAVITRFAEVPVHVEFFASPEAVRKEKILLARAVKEGGTLVLGSDDEKVAALKNEFPDLHPMQYGVGEGGEVRGVGYQVEYEGGRPIGISFRVLVGTQSFPVSIKGVLGVHLIQPVLAAFAVVHSLGLDLARAGEAFRDFKTPPGRMRLISGLNNSLIIDDSYNASPVAMREALATLASLETRGRKIAVLGGMAELGKFSAEEHRKVGELALRSCDKLVLVGKLARGMTSDPTVAYFETSREAADALVRDIRVDDVVLIKGSQSVRMERVVKALMKEPECAKELLVRQEWEWRDR